MPSEAVAEAVLAEWPEEDLRGKRILLPRAAEAREVLPEQLRARGAAVEVLPIYETRLDASASESLRAQLEHGEIEVITFTSSSTVRNFAQAIPCEDRERLRQIADRTLVAAIGPITAETAREHGLNPQIVAEMHTIPGLVAALESYFRCTS